MQPKPYKTYRQQVALLESRGMGVGDHRAAEDHLRHVNYYRLSGYWYPFRQVRGQARADEFYPGTRLEDVIKLYRFDENLRAVTFAALAPIELTLRALIGHELGKIDACAHLKPELLNSRASGSSYLAWAERYKRALADSREDFVDHHRNRYAGVLPVWVAVEILDWGPLTRLYGFSPRRAQDRVADAFELRAPQLESWLKSLNIVRNVCAHHGRLFNRVFALKPKLPPAQSHPYLRSVGPLERTFGQLSLVQHLLRAQNIGKPSILPGVFASFPDIDRVPLQSTGAPENWAMNPIWH